MATPGVPAGSRSPPSPRATRPRSGSAPRPHRSLPRPSPSRRSIGRCGSDAWAGWGSISPGRSRTGSTTVSCRQAATRSRSARSGRPPGRRAMDITTDRPSTDVAVIALDGELDGSNFEQVIDAGRAARDGGARRIVLDLSGLTYMGSSGLVAIHSVALLMDGKEPTSSEDGWQSIHDLDHTAAERESGVVIAGPQASVQRVLERSGMIGLFAVHPDRATALDAATV